MRDYRAEGVRQTAVREAVLIRLGCGRNMIITCLWQGTSDLSEEEREDKCHGSAIDHYERVRLYVYVCRFGGHWDETR